LHETFSFSWFASKKSYKKNALTRIAKSNKETKNSLKSRVNSPKLLTVRLKLVRTMKQRLLVVWKINIVSSRMKLPRNSFLAIKSLMICTHLFNLTCPRSKGLLNLKRQREKKTTRAWWRLLPSSLVKSMKTSMLKRSKESNQKQPSSTCLRMLSIVSRLNLMEKRRQGNNNWFLFC